MAFFHSSSGVSAWNSFLIVFLATFLFQFHGVLIILQLNETFPLLIIKFYNLFKSYLSLKFQILFVMDFFVLIFQSFFYYFCLFSVVLLEYFCYSCSFLHFQFYQYYCLLFWSPFVLFCFIFFIYEFMFLKTCGCHVAATWSTVFMFLCGPVSKWYLFISFRSSSLSILAERIANLSLFV